MSPELDEKIDRLLHDAEHKDGGAAMARYMGDKPAFASMMAERDALVAEAAALDPNREHWAWREELAIAIRPLPPALAAPAPDRGAAE